MGEGRMNFESVDRRGSSAVKWEGRKAKFGTEALLPLWVADMDLASPPVVQEAMLRRAEHPIYGYTIYPDAYYDAIILWMESRFGRHIEKSWIVPAFGVVSSIHFSIEALTRPGDGVIVQTPIYPPFIASVQKHRRRLLENRLLYDEQGYHIDFDDLARKAKEAKLLLFCSPHNPVGRVWSRTELERLVEICRENDLMIVSDEIHADIVYEKEHHVMAALAPERTILLNAPSKTFNIAGLNTSYAIIPERALRRAYLGEQRRSGLGDGNPFGIEALIAAYRGGEAWLEALKGHLKKNIDFVQAFIAQHRLAITPVRTEATFLIWLDCRALGMDERDLEAFFVEEAQLGLNSGRSFGEAGSGFMRLNIGISRELLEEAMESLLRAYRRRGLA